MSKNIKATEAKLDPKAFAIDILITIMGTMLFALAVHMFTVPNHIAPGGIAGISTILNYLTKYPIGIINIILNIPIIIIGIIYLGKRFMIKTFISIVTFTLSMDYILVNLPTYTNDKIVATIFGGLLMGAGAGFVLTRASSTGGMDVINKIIAKKLPHIKLGKIIFCSDLVVITLSGFAFGSAEPVLYAAITLYISATALDTVLYGFNVCKLMYIVSEKSDEIAKRIITEMKRGATILESHGAYTNTKKPTIMCAVRQNEYFRMKKIVQSTDPNAFIIIASGTEIVGSGFKSNDQ